MMHFQDFLSLYVEAGGTIVEQKNVNKFLGMMRGLAQPPTEKPEDQVPDPTTGKRKTYANQLGDAASKGDFGIEKKDGNIAYRGTGSNAPFFDFTHKNKAGTYQVVSFTRQEWDEMKARWEEGARGAGADGDEAPAGTPEAQQPTEEDPEGPAEEQELLLRRTSDEAGAKMEASFDSLGFPDETGRIMAMQRQMRGQGQKNQLREAAFRQPNEDGSPRTAQEVNDAADRVNDAVTRAQDLYLHVRRGKPLEDPEDEKFLRKCFKLRGRGKTQGIYIKGGEACGGELASIGAEITPGGDIYGVKIGTQNSPLFKMMVDLHKKAGKDGKPLVTWGRADTAAENTFNAINGVLNEFMPAVGHALFVKKDKKLVKKLYQDMVDDLGSKHDLKLFLEIAKAKNGGTLDEFEVADWFEEGSMQILDEILDFFGGDEVDEKRALGWVVGRQLKKWKDFVETFPECTEFEQVGGGPTGIGVGGVITNEDMKVACGQSLPPDKMLKELSNNSKLDISKGREGEEGVVGFSVKEMTSKGKTTTMGKRGVWKLRGEGPLGSADDVNTARATQMDYMDAAAKKYGADMPEGWREEADEFRYNEQKTVDTIVSDVVELRKKYPGMDDEEFKLRLREMGYEDYEKYKPLFDSLKEYADTDPTERKKLRGGLVTKLTLGYRKKHENDPALRYHLGVEAAITGMSTQRQGFAATSDEGTYVGLESDVAGAFVMGIVGVGEDEPPKMRFTTGGIYFYNEIEEDGKTRQENLGNLTMRLKEGSPSQFLNIDNSYIHARTRKLEPGETMGEYQKGTRKVESLTVEDLIWKLQELL